MRIAFLHGYLLKATGSNIYVQNITKQLVKQGHEVHIFCQERHPGNYNYIKKAYSVSPESKEVKEYYKNDKLNHGAIVINPEIEFLPVYVMDKYPDFKEVKLFVDLTDKELSEYVNRNVEAISLFFEKYKYDVIHANHLVMMPYISYILSKRFNVPYVITPHGSSLEYTIKKDQRYEKFAVTGLTYAKYIFPGNSTFRNTLLKRFGNKVEALKNKMKIVPLGVDTDLFTPVQENQKTHVLSELIKKLNTEKGGRSKEFEEVFLKKINNATGREIDSILNAIPSYSQRAPDENVGEKLERINPETDKLLVFLGRLIVGKGIHNFLISIIPLLEKVPQLKVVIVGAGPLREWGEWLIHVASQGNIEMIKALVEWGFQSAEDKEKELWVPLKHFIGSEQFYSFKNIRFDPTRVIFTGFLDHSHLAPLLGITKFACFPSVVPESFGLVLLEAASCGVVPIASYFSGFKEILDDFRNALPEDIFKNIILPASGLEIVSTLIENLSEIIRLSPQISTVLRNLVIEKYSWKSSAAKLIQVYKSFKKKIK